MTDHKCRILFIGLCIDFGGAEKHLISLINGLDESYFEVHFCYLKDFTGLLHELKKDKLKGLFCANVSKKVDFKVVNLLTNYVDGNYIDIIVNIDMYPMIYSSLIKALSKRNLFIIEILHSARVNSFREKLEVLFYKPLLYIQNRIVYVSQNQRIFWRQKGICANRDCVIYTGIDTEYFKDIHSAQEKLAVRQSYGFSNDDYLIGICAALRPEKAHYDLLQAIKNLQTVGVFAKCLIIGDGEERENIEKQIIELGLQHNVAITGYQMDVKPYIAACDVMAIVSRFESFSIAILEAMSMGKPVIRSNACGGTELVTDGVDGYLFPSGNIPALEEVLLKLNDVHTRAGFGKEARKKVVAQFSVNRMIDQFQKLFLDLQIQHQLK